MTPLAVPPHWLCPLAVPMTPLAVPIGCAHDPIGCAHWLCPPLAVPYNGDMTPLAVPLAVSRHVFCSEFHIRSLSPK